jgi:hypothetical protein
VLGRAWSIWAVSGAATATALAYTAVHPLPAKLASQVGSGLDVLVVVVFVAAFATVGALLAWKRPGWSWSMTGVQRCGPNAACAATPGILCSAAGLRQRF